MLQKIVSVLSKEMDQIDPHARLSRCILSRTAATCPLVRLGMESVQAGLVAVAEAEAEVAAVVAAV